MFLGMQEGGSQIAAWQFPINYDNSNPNSNVHTYWIKVWGPHCITLSSFARYCLFGNFLKLHCRNMEICAPARILIRIHFCGWKPADFPLKPERRLFDICLLANLFEKSYINSGRGAANFCTLEEKCFLIWRGLLLLGATRVVSKCFWYLMTVA